MDPCITQKFCENIFKKKTEVKFQFVFFWSQLPLTFLNGAGQGPELA